MVGDQGQRWNVSALARLATLPLLAYNFNAITYTGGYAYIQILTKKNHSIISKISLDGQFLRKTFKRKVLKIVLEYLSNLLLDFFRSNICCAECRILF